MRTRSSLILPVTVMLALILAACGSDTPADDFEAGECTNDELGGLVGEIETVDCAGVHTAEAYAQFDIEGDDFPGDEQIDEDAAEGCTGSRFEDYVGVTYDESIYEVSTIKPNESSWNGADDRTVICIIVGTVDGSPLEGSAKGTAT